METSKMSLLNKIQKDGGLPRYRNTYKPATRLEKIKGKGIVYPSSTDTKFVFISNMDGAGFQR
jgi:hypothetical protein